MIKIMILCFKKVIYYGKKSLKNIILFTIDKYLRVDVCLYYLVK